MATSAGNRAPERAGFVHALYRYWLDVFPRTCAEIGRWHRRAAAIPDATLREIARTAHITKRGNLEGAAAFAAFATPADRPAVVRAQVACQAIYDYIDSLAERPTKAPVKNGRQLHQALVVALDPSACHPDYYAYNPEHADSGYLVEIVEACRHALGTLPSYPSVAESARRLATRIVCYQSLNLTEAQGALRRWAHAQTPPQCRLRWWEIAASAGSSLGIFALMATASKPQISTREAIMIENAYFPWIGSLHSLLDSLIDLPEDVRAGQPNLVAHYASTQEMATRMRLIASECVHRTQSLPDRTHHSLILTAMACHYLGATEAHLPHARQARAQVLDALGIMSRPTMVVFDLRRPTRRLKQSPGSTR